ncbi:COG3531 Predicted protein-disulfide isomerase [Rhabdaerophilaceae bacterium]
MTDIIPGKPRLLAFLDCMCSWCYGFAPAMEAVRRHFGDRLDYMLFTGGLRPFTTEPMAEAMRRKLAGVYMKIEEVSGQPFTTARLMDPAFIYDTEPASRAIVAMRHFAPAEDYSFYLSIQKAFYARGEDITHEDVLAAYAELFGVARGDFLEAFRSEAIKQAVLGDFDVARRFGIDGFPSLVLHRLESANPQAMIMVRQGYAPAEQAIREIEAGLAAEV